jgi:hypothetical protein
MTRAIKPGKVTCAGLVAILMILPASLWKGGSGNATVRVTGPRPEIPGNAGRHNRSKGRG